MELPMSILLDLALGLILLSILYVSWKQGFMATVIRLAGTVAGFLLASVASRPAAEAIYDRFLEDRVVDYVRDNLLSEESALTQALASMDQAGEAAREAIAGFLEEWGLDYYSSSDAGEMGSDILDRLSQGADPAQTVAQVAVRPMVMTLLEIVVFFVVLFLVGLLVKILTGLALGVNHIPLVGGVNRLAGLLCGGVYALLVGYLVSAALVFLVGVSKNQWEFLNSGILRDTWLIQGLLGLRQLQF